MLDAGVVYYGLMLGVVASDKNIFIVVNFIGKTELDVAAAILFTVNITGVSRAMALIVSDRLKILIHNRSINIQRIMSATVDTMDS